MKQIEKSAFVVGVCYAPWFLKSAKPQHAVLNDFYAFIAAYVLRDEFDLNVGNALTRSFHNQSWFLAPTITVFSIADPDLETAVKLASSYQNWFALMFQKKGSLRFKSLNQCVSFLKALNQILLQRIAGLCLVALDWWIKFFIGLI